MGPRGELSLHQLRVFAALVSRGSYTAAAEHLHLTQPAVSQQIKALEAACGVRLVERANNRIVPTHAGEVLNKYAQSMIHLEQEALNAIEEFRAGARGRFVVGANTTGGMYIVPPLLASYREQNPETEVILRIEGTESILAAIAARTMDIGFVGGHIADRRFSVEPVVADKLVLIAAPGHPLAITGTTTVEGLAQETFILARYGSTTRRLIEHRLREHGVNLRVGLEMAGTEDIKKAVEAGLGVAVVSQWSVLRELAAGYLKQIQVVGVDLTRSYEMITHKGRYYTPVLEGFMDFIRHEAPKLTFASVLRRPVRS